MHAASRQATGADSPKKKRKNVRKTAENLIAAAKPIHEPRIQAKSRIVRTVILTADRRARVQSKERIARIQKVWWWLVVKHQSGCGNQAPKKHANIHAYHMMHAI